MSGSVSAVEPFEDALEDARATSARMGVSKRLVYTLAQSGRLPSYRIANAIRFRPSEVEAWLSEQKTRVAP